MSASPRENLVSLYRAPADPDGWHEVTAPGGYEWWYFDADDPSNDTHVVAILLEGFIFHPGYLRTHARFARRPTRHSPPRPRDYACAYLVVYRGKRIVHQFMTQYRADQFHASPDAPRVTLGPNRLWRDESDAYRLSLRGVPWQLTGRGPKTLHGQSLSAELTFRPRATHPPMERVFLSRRMTGAEHHWVIAAPSCDVTGLVERSDANGTRLDRIEFNGRGYHDHNYGTAPIGRGLKRWIWGRVLDGDRAATFHLAVARDHSLPDEFHLVKADDTAIREIAAPAPRTQWNRHTLLGLAYPDSLQLADDLRLHSPRVIDSAPFYLRVVYRADFAGRECTALCEVAYPHRLRWPILGRMIEMSIDKSALRGPR
jgi:carotenoid 1,2-hydratase